MYFNTAPSTTHLFGFDLLALWLPILSKFIMHYTKEEMANIKNPNSENATDNAVVLLIGTLKNSLRYCTKYYTEYCMHATNMKLKTKYNKRK